MAPWRAAGCATCEVGKTRNTHPPSPAHAHVTSHLMPAGPVSHIIGMLASLSCMHAPRRQGAPVYCHARRPSSPYQHLAVTELVYPGVATYLTATPCR